MTPATNEVSLLETPIGHFSWAIRLLSSRILISEMPGVAGQAQGVGMKGCLPTETVEDATGKSADSRARSNTRP